MSDPERMTSGIGPGAKDSGTATVNVPAEAEKNNTDAPKILPFQLTNSIPTIAGYITELMSLRKMLEDYAEQQYVSEQKKVASRKLIDNINKINRIFASRVMTLLDELAL